MEVYAPRAERDRGDRRDWLGCRRRIFIAAIAVPRLLYLGATKAKWLFLEERATWNDAGNGIQEWWNRSSMSGNALGTGGRVVNGSRL